MQRNQSQVQQFDQLVLTQWTKACCQAHWRTFRCKPGIVALDLTMSALRHAPRVKLQFALVGYALRGGQTGSLHQHRWEDDALTSCEVSGQLKMRALFTAQIQ